MKHLVISLFLLQIVAISGFAQRNIDISLDEIIDPVKIYHNQVIKTRFTVKNLGPHQVKTGDTLFYFAIMNKGKRVTPTGIFIFSKNLSLNDTSSFSFEISPEQITGMSIESDFCILMEIRNRSKTDSVITESISGTANNLKCKTLPYINSNGWGVGINDLFAISDSVVFYPNPARDKGHLVLNKPISIPSSVAIFDIMGRQVLKQNVQVTKSDDNIIELNLNTLDSGIYFYDLILNETHNCNRFIISK
jgi:hypothetical protein